MSTGTVFTNNRTQNIRIPAELRFPDGVKTVEVRAVGRDLIISPVENTWDSFFLAGESVSDDFMAERTEPAQQERESFDD
ncbi:putative virulence-associated protein [Pseudomonas sp. FH4]|jgi:antitoxin VapB|uniref:Antitoxin n=1 Tax=Pseudomonas brenneri TaxID=129817 RepID=A0A5B2UU56_9PSED|nr:MULTISPECIES: type II toxin-antitoxin system VapB family antitoxin [Pseudomonas]KAA6173452.1 antitoxin [Pseudomonas marginalis]ETK16010.1 putative virulence-associated protein [Pseudomonas sp. FH4]KAA2230281.1 antitoxin [Pseudomonas brenneri]MBF8005245.1 antitoxin [Pseudomonas brenneri]MBT9300786.1 antitoxin [Pseudomonas sp. TAE6080]